MKYKNTQQPYIINIQYKNSNEFSKLLNPRVLWTLYSLDYKYLPLDDCVFCSWGVSNKLSTYNNCFQSFTLSSIWICNILNKYDIQDCLIISNRLNFLESLLYYKIDKIGFMPVHIDKDYGERFNCQFSVINNTYQNKIKIEFEETKTKYNNIIFYVSSNIYAKDTREITIYNSIIKNILEALKKLKEGGNLIFRILYNDNDTELNNYNIELIYLLSTCFESVEYLYNDYSAKSFYLKNMCVFEGYKNNHTVFNKIYEKIIENKNSCDIITKFIDIKYDDKFIDFIKYLDSILYVYSAKLIEKYNNKKELIDYSFTNTYTSKFYDELYKLNFMKNLDNSINLAQKANIEINNKYITLNTKFKNNMKKEITREPKLKYYDTSNNHNISFELEHTRANYLTNIGNYEIMRIYLAIRDKNKIKDIIKKFSITDYFISYLSKYLQYSVSLKFIKIYELISYFKLINTNKKLETLHICENNTDAVLAINHYYKQYNTKNDFLWKIYLTNNNSKINKKNQLFDNSDNNYDITNDATQKYITDNYQNIDICTFDANKDDKYLIITQIFICLMVLKQGGNSIFKIYVSDIDDLLLGYINLLKLYFEVLYFSKSSIDFFENKEVYIVAKNKIKDIDETLFYKQIEYITKYNEKYDISMCDLNFLLVRPINLLLKQEIRILFIILYYYENISELNIKSTQTDKFIKKWLKKYNIRPISS